MFHFKIGHYCKFLFLLHIICDILITTGVASYFIRILTPLTSYKLPYNIRHCYYSWAFQIYVYYVYSIIGSRHFLLIFV